MTYYDLYYAILPFAIIILMFLAFTLGYFAHARKQNNTESKNNFVSFYSKYIIINELNYMMMCRDSKTVLPHISAWDR